MALSRSTSSTYGKDAGYCPNWTATIDGVDCMAQAIWLLEMTLLRNQHSFCMGSCKIILCPHTLQHASYQPYAAVDHEFEYVDGGAAGSFDPDAFLFKLGAKLSSNCPAPHYHALGEARMSHGCIPDAHTHMSSLRI